MNLQKIEKYGIGMLFWLMLCVYAFSIVTVNFSGNPLYYVTDMYSDMIYAEQVWVEKSIFPDGWIFGNQLYAVATPVLAAFFYGLTGDHSIAMAAAASVMALAVLFSFYWMLKPVVPGQNPRLAGILIFLAFVLAAGNPIYSTNGWQLFFTMCAYYACYAITAFLAFGCYLRCDAPFSRQTLIVLVLTCLLGFGTGLQSLRQTAVLVCPLVAVEALRVLLSFARGKKLRTRPLFVAGSIAACNIFGVFYAALILDVEQVRLFGGITFTFPTDLPQAWTSAVTNACSLFMSTAEARPAVLALGALVGMGLLLWRLKARNNTKAILCVLLFAVSVGGILLLDMITTMYIRSIYYFMIYPLAAVLGVCLYAHGGRISRYLLVISLALLLFFNWNNRLTSVYNPPTAYPALYEEVSDYLQEEEISTIYSGWNRGEKIAIASNFQLRAGFWDSRNTPFVPVKYLCDPEIFTAESESCAYIFFGQTDAGIAIRAAAKKGAELTLLKYFPKSDIYVFTCQTNLMQLFGN